MANPIKDGDPDMPGYILTNIPPTTLNFLINKAAGAYNLTVKDAWTYYLSGDLIFHMEDPASTTIYISYGGGCVITVLEGPIGY